jgi:hypothetical protein
MKSIITTYPDFQSLPQGIKRMLLASESHFFGEIQAPAEASKHTLAAHTTLDGIPPPAQNASPKSRVELR